MAKTPKSLKLQRVLGILSAIGLKDKKEYPKVIPFPLFFICKTELPMNLAKSEDQVDYYKYW